MKKVILALLTIVVMLSFVACAGENSSIASVDDIGNPMLVAIGHEVTIGGVVYTAEMLTLTDDGTFNDIAYNNAYFAVNRINKHIYYIRAGATTSRVPAWAIDTGLVYEGELAVDGVPVPTPQH